MNIDVQVGWAILPGDPLSQRVQPPEKVADNHIPAERS